MAELNKLIVASGDAPAPNSPGQLSSWNSLSSEQALQLGLSALQSIETLRALRLDSPRRAKSAHASAFARLLRLSKRPQSNRDSPESYSPSQLSAWNSASSNRAQRLGHQALQVLQALQTTSARRRRVAGTKRNARQLSEKALPGCSVQKEPVCDRNAVFRTVSGECNNLRRPTLGRSLTGFRRLLPNTFDDGLFEPRSKAKRGGTLPNPRLISQRTMDSMSVAASGFTASLMQWGQFIDHDLTQAPVFRLESGDGIECCKRNGQEFPSEPRHPLCIPVRISESDPFYSRFGQRCMSVVRSLPAPEPDCHARPATQLNALTDYLDASNVYGSREEQLAELRLFRRGLLRSGKGGLLPARGTEPFRPPGDAGRRQSRKGEPPNGRCRGTVCFRAGDERANEQGSLTVVHTVFMRAHNNVARALRRNHPNWGDEQLFSEARRVLTGQWQHMVYNEWLPLVVGHEFARAHGLLPLERGFSSLYNADIDARATVEFASAAFRFGHSMVLDSYELLDARGRVRSINLTSTFFEPSSVSSGLMDYARMLVASPSDAVDMSIVPAVHGNLFNAGGPHGLDLITLNIQRGRDHGAPSYVSALTACTGADVQHWGDLNKVMFPFALERLREVYDHPHDVDLFVGGLGEIPAKDAVVGPTFRCLIAQGFFDVRYGDRFFYDNGGFRHSFTARQLAEIRKSSWAGLLCDTLGRDSGGNFNHVHPLAFRSAAGFNQPVDCDSLAISRPDLRVF
ncbi:chorion peroxidase-like [Pollicipes pollicipes]|uniref:chorion peroxidase-like n=1 Tax=Pollicipes pollicipes TaxID=41117 RepID=UPI001884FA26|nr:chorion peroxidase-like [Pollicipes pollicipes]